MTRMRIRACRSAMMLAWALSSGVLIACEGGEAEPPAEIAFQVDSLLLGDRYSDEHFSIRAPRDWLRIPDSIVNQGMAAVQTDSGFDATRDPSLCAVFGPTIDGSMLAVSDYRNAALMTDLDSIAHHVRNALALRSDISQLQEDTFTYNGFFVRQWRYVRTEGTIGFKLLLSNPTDPVAQLDYTLPLATAEQYMRRLESSIGSLVATH